MYYLPGMEKNNKIAILRMRLGNGILITLDKEYKKQNLSLQYAKQKKNIKLFLEIHNGQTL